MSETGAKPNQYSTALQIYMSNLRYPTNIPVVLKQHPNGQQHSNADYGYFQAVILDIQDSCPAQQINLWDGSWDNLDECAISFHVSWWPSRRREGGGGAPDIDNVNGPNFSMPGNPVKFHLQGGICHLKNCSNYSTSGDTPMQTVVMQTSSGGG